MDNTSREQTTTDHGLRVLVRIDTRQRLACLEVRGCLTPETFPTLVNILSHTGSLGAAVSVNLLRAAHVDAVALDRLLAGADNAVRAEPGRASAAPVEILVPPVLPYCRLKPDPAAPDATRPDPVQQTPQPIPRRPSDGPASRRALTNEEAADLAFRRRDPRVLAKPSHFRPQVL